MSILSRRYKNLVWDYNLKEKEFDEILSGKSKNKYFTQDWAISRVVENLNYYEAMNLISWGVLEDHWKSVRLKIFNQSIISGYDFLLQKSSLSTSR